MRISPVRPLLVAAALLVFVGVGCGLWKTEFEGKVTRVLHGDTLKVQKPNGRISRVVLAGVETPKRGQPFRKEARELARKLVLKKKVHIRSVGRDYQGHYRAVVTLPDGKRTLNRILVRAGLAWAVPDDDTDPQLVKLQERARRSHKGLWRDPDPVPPWEYLAHKSWKNP